MIKIITLLFVSSVVCAKTTVFCLHGFMRSPLSMEGISLSLKRHGFEVNNWNYPSRSQTIDEHAEALLRQLQKVARKKPNTPICFVTHSMGGLVVRRALNLPDCPDEAKWGKAVLIAPPNQGSTFAQMMAEGKTTRSILGTQAGRELMEAENFDYLGQFPPTMDILVIAGKLGLNFAVDGANDGKVSVEETRLSTPHEHIVIMASHSWITYSPRAIKETRKFLLSN